MSRRRRKPKPAASNGDDPVTPSGPSDTPGSTPPPPARIGTSYCKPDQTPAWKMLYDTATLLVGITAVIVYELQLHTANRATANSLKTELAINMPFLIPSGSYINWNNTAPKGNGSIWVKQKIQNVGGGTRAMNTRVVFGWGYEPPTANTIFQGRYEQTAFSVLLPNETGDSGRAIMSLDEAQRAAEAVRMKRPFYAYAQVRYDDIFPIDAEGGRPRSDHLTKDCVRIVQFDTGEENDGKSTRWTGEPCPGKAICSDNDCPESDYKYYKANSRATLSKRLLRRLVHLIRN